jgi:hypothetical protein
MRGVEKEVRSEVAPLDAYVIRVVSIALAILFFLGAVGK